MLLSSVEEPYYFNATVALDPGRKTDAVQSSSQTPIRLLTVYFAQVQ
jgi:hypothetical protein